MLPGIFFAALGALAENGAAQARVRGVSVPALQTAAPAQAVSAPALQSLQVTPTLLAPLPSAPPSLAESVAGLVQRDFLSKKYSRPFLKGLGPAKAAALIGEAGFKPSPAALRELGAALSRRFVALPFAAALHGPLALKSEKREHNVFLMTFLRGGSSAGYAGYVLRRAKDGAVEGELHGVYFDKSDPSVSGVADALLEFLKSDLDPALGVTREKLKADYAGRYVWAKKGFRFDPAYRYYDVDGKKYDSAELARRSLERFLKSRGLALGELSLRGRSVLSLDELSAPADFAGLEHRDGKTVRLRPLVNHERLGEETELSVGKAFMMGNYLPVKPPFVLSQGGPAMGSKFAPDAMPFWNGYR